VKPGGRLVYATCSLLEQENEAVVAAFSAAQPEFEEVSCEKLLEAQRIALTSGKYLKLFPHRHGTDAFFAAVFERRKA
jgi:16S rRNA (cytosine967-C5)-methyltransferase